VWEASPVQRSDAANCDRRIEIRDEWMGFWDQVDQGAGPGVGCSSVALRASVMHVCDGAATGWRNRTNPHSGKERGVAENKASDSSEIYMSLTTCRPRIARVALGTYKSPRESECRSTTAYTSEAQVAPPVRAPPKYDVPTSHNVTSDVMQTWRSTWSGQLITVVRTSCGTEHRARDLDVRQQRRLAQSPPLGVETLGSSRNALESRRQRQQQEQREQYWNVERNRADRACNYMGALRRGARHTGVVALPNGVELKTRASQGFINLPIARITHANCAAVE